MRLYRRNTSVTIKACTIWLLVLIISDWFVCSLITMVCVFPYGSVDWLQLQQKGTEYAPSANNYNQDSYPTHVICHTTHLGIAHTHTKKPFMFLAKAHNHSVAYLSINNEYHMHLTEPLFDRPCGYLHNNTDHFCCMYSENLDTVNGEQFAYYKTYHEDPYFHIEDIFYGKSEQLHQRIEFVHVVSELERVIVSVEHQCRSDVKVDPYPEVHIHVSTEHLVSRRNETVHFHWYL